MDLPVDLVRDYAKSVVKATAYNPNAKEESTLFGTAVEYEDSIYVKLDGSDQLTPVSTTATLKAGDRVQVTIKNHKATVTGNTSDPSASGSRVTEIGDQISEFEIIIADKVDTIELDAQIARIDDLYAENVTINGKLEANEADIGDLQAENVTITGRLEAAEADIDHLTATKIDADIVEANYATIENLEATNANIHNLEADYGDFKDLTTDRLEAQDATIGDLEVNKLDVDDAEIHYANIDFTNIGVAAVEELFAKSGIIEDLVVSGGHITGELVGVTIKGDLIEGNTIVADKLVIKGTDGLYYKLNTDGVTTSAEQTEYNSLNGSVITAHTITAEKINVNDLVAFNATIGGYHISSGSLYSGAKASATNTTRGVFMGSDGQFAVGDGTNYLKFFKDTDGSYKLDISARNILMGTSNKPIDDYISDELASLAVGTRNLLLDSANPADHFAVSLQNGSKTVEAAEMQGVMGAVATVTQASTGWAYSQYSFGASRMELIQPSTEYTLSFDVNSSVGGSINWKFMNGDVTDQVSGQSPDFSVPANKWTHVAMTVTTYSTVTISSQVIYMLGLFTKAGTHKVCNFKLEKGNVATDWTPAPEDLVSSEDLDSVKEEITSQIDTKISQTETGIMSQVTESTYQKGEIDELLKQTSTSFTQNQNSFEMQFNQQITQLGNQITEVSDSYDDFSKYIRFENGDIVLGEVGNELVLRIQNDRIAFLQSNNEVAYFTNQKLYVTNAEIITQLAIGNFTFMPRSNGNMTLRYTG